MAEYPHILAENLLETATVSFTDGGGNPLTEDQIYRLTHLADRSRLSKWQGHGSAAEQRVVFAFGQAKEADTFVLDRNFSLPGASVSVKLDYSATGSAWYNAVTIDSPQADTIYWRAFEAKTKPYWRLRLEGLAGAPVIFNLWLGKRLELAAGVAGDFDPYEQEKTGESVHGAAGGFQRVHRFSRRVLRAAFRNLTDSQYSVLAAWWTQAGRDDKNWWWLTFPSTEPDDALYLNCEGTARRFALSASVRGGSLEAWEVL